MDKGLTALNYFCRLFIQTMSYGLSTTFRQAKTPPQYEHKVQERFRSATKEKTDAAIELRRREQQIQAQERQIIRLQQEVKDTRGKLQELWGMLELWSCCI